MSCSALALVPACETQVLFARRRLFSVCFIAWRTSSVRTLPWERDPDPLGINAPLASNVPWGVIPGVAQDPSPRDLVPSCHRRPRPMVTAPRRSGVAEGFHGSGAVSYTHL